MSINTDVSSRPRARRLGLTTRCDFLACCFVQIRSELAIVNPGRGPEKCDGRLCGDESMAAQRRQLTDGHTIARDDEGLALVESAHDVAALVPKLPLADLATHRPSVARRATQASPPPPNPSGPSEQVERLAACRTDTERRGRPPRIANPTLVVFPARAFRRAERRDHIVEHRAPRPLLSCRNCDATPVAQPVTTR